MTDSLSAAASRCLSHDSPFVRWMGTHGGIPGGHSGAGRQHPVLGARQQETPSSLCPSSKMEEQGIFGHKYQTARPEGNEDRGKADDRKPEGAEDATEVQKKSSLVSD